MKEIDEFLTDEQINEALSRMEAVCDKEERYFDEDICFDLLYELSLEGVKDPVRFVDRWIESKLLIELELLRYQELGYEEKLEELGIVYSES